MWEVGKDERKKRKTDFLVSMEVTHVSVFYVQ